MTPRENALMKLSVHALDGQTADAGAMKVFIAFCDLLVEFHTERLEITLNANRRVVRIVSTDEKGPATISTQDYFLWRPLTDLLKVVRSPEIRGHSVYHINPIAYAFERVAQMRKMLVENNRGGTEQIDELAMMDEPISIL